MPETDPTPEERADEAQGGQAPGAEEAELRRQLEETTAKLRTVSKAWQDQAAEAKAFRERFEAAAKARAERQGLELVRAFFEPVMNLKRSINADWSDPASLRAGLDMVNRQFMDVLERLGLESVPGVGARFEPSIHEAVGTVEVADRAEDGVVVAVHSDGYHVKGQVLQPARVTVGKFTEPAGEA
jgi:molecular chaperone GrpE